MAGSSDTANSSELAVSLNELAPAAITAREHDGAHRRIEEILRRRLRLERIVSEISTRFVHAGAARLDAAIDAALRVLGEFADADRGYVILLDKTGAYCSNTHEWCAAGVSAQRAARQNIPPADTPWFWRQLTARATVHIPVVAELPPEARTERAMLQAQDVRSLIAVPLALADRVLGFIGFDRVRDAGAWAEDDIHLLQTVADIFATAIERQQIETALIFSEQKFARAFAASPDLICISTLRDGRYIEVNAAFERVLGYSRAELIGRSSLELGIWNDPGDRARFIEILRAQGEVNNFEARWHRRAGTETVPMLISAKPMEVDGQPCLLAIIRDISVRTQALEALRDSEQRLRQVIDLVPHALFAKDVEGRYILANQAGARLFGRPVEAILGKTDLEVAPTLDEARGIRADDLEVIRTGRAKSLVETITNPHGQPRILQTTKIPFRVSGSAALAVLGMAIDVTERHRAENQLRLAAQVFENSGEAIMITDIHRRFLSVNRAFTRITGYSPEEAIGKTPRLLSSERHGKEFYDALWETLERTGHWQGEMWNRRKNGELYPQWLSVTAVRDEQGQITNYIGVSSDITEYKAAQQRIQYLAHYDVLTGLPNRALLHDRLGRAFSAAERHYQDVALLFLDLDRFKHINDSLGHNVGDRLLQAVAERLKGCVRDMDTVSRLGGDEFIVVLPETGADGAAHVAQKILAALSEPYPIEHYRLAVTVSIGISVYPHDGTDVDTLIRDADVALYHAKDQGRNNFQFFTQDMNNTVFERMFLENALRLALERREFMLHYQPQRDIASGRVIGMEALLRWQHRGMGLIAPAKFIPIAEDSQLIIPIGAWVIREACRQNAEWQRSGLAALPIAVNLSAVQFRHKDFKETLTGALEESGLEPRYLELELTETTLMKDEEKTIVSLRDLARLGVRLTVDDFGTGYSSLSYLKRFPLDKLKIDRSFVRDIGADADDAAIVRAVIGLAHSLRLKVIAEGVETVEQLAFLRAEGCDEIQGYHGGKPMPAVEFARFLSTPPPLD